MPGITIDTTRWRQGIGYLGQKVSIPQLWLWRRQINSLKKKKKVMLTQHTLIFIFSNSYFQDM